MNAAPAIAVASYYFGQYHPNDPRNAETKGLGWSEWELLKAAKPRFPGHQQPKVPLWGYQDESDPQVMARKIAAAAEHGIAAFIFDWYYYDDGPFLDRTVNEGFLKATNNARLNFAFMWANHDWQGNLFPYKKGEPRKIIYPGKVSPAGFARIGDHVIKDYFLRDNYWRIDGKPYFSFYDLSALLESFGSVETTRTALDGFRAKARVAGLPGLHLNAVAWGQPVLPGGKQPVDSAKLVQDLGFDSVTSYVWVHHAGLPHQATAYDAVRDEYFAYWDRALKTFNVPYFPNITMGWDPSPRCDQRDTLDNSGYPFTHTIKDNTPDRFRMALLMAKNRLWDQKSGPRVLNINCWNEWTEGSYLEPDTVNGMKYLEAVRDVFGIRPGNREGEAPEAEAPAEALAPPRWFNALGTYGRNVLFWRSTEKSDRSTAVIIERREGEDGRWRAISPDIRDADRWFDNEVRPDRSYSYRASSLAGTRRSEFTPVRSASPRDPNPCSLPVYELTLPEAGRNAMLANPRQDVEVEGQFHFQGQPYPVRIRLHGQSTRLAQKKSYRLEFLDRSPLTRPVTFLKAEPMDHTLQQEKLSCDVFRRVGAWVSQADYVHLFINRRYEGVYLDIEPIRSPFKENTGLDPQGTLIRASTFQHLEGWEGLGELMGKTGSLEELTEFLRQINRTDRGEFETWLRSAVDWPRIRDFLALNVVCHRLEMEANDYFFYRPKGGTWSLIPWDHNNGNFGVAPFGNRVREPSIHIFSQAIQEVGWRSPYWYVLPSRIYQNDRLRAEYLDRLKELTTSLLLSGTLDAMIERNVEQLNGEYVVDPYRVAFEGTDPFLRSAQDLKRFVWQHGERLLRLIEQERNRKAPALTISEFSFGAESGWVELHNRGPESVSLRGYLLVTKGRDGNRELPLSESEVLRPNNYTVVTCPRQTGPQSVVHRNDADAPREDAPAASVRSERDVAQPFPGFDPAGGFIGLVQRQAEFKSERREELVDFWHYGAGSPGRSYGRFGAEFAELEPTPGRTNIRAITK
jgi:hypothetical protein